MLGHRKDDGIQSHAEQGDQGVQDRTHLQDTAEIRGGVYRKEAKITQESELPREAVRSLAFRCIAFTPTDLWIRRKTHGGMD